VLPVNVDYGSLETDLATGMFRQSLADELTVGFRIIRDSGERLPLPSHYASQIAEIVNRGASAPLDSNLAFELYQETLAACEQARAMVLGEPPAPAQ
jgi:hypothetical protein